MLLELEEVIELERIEVLVATALEEVEEEDGVDELEAEEAPV